MTEFFVRPADVSTRGHNISNVADDITAQLSQLQAYVEETQSFWRGGDQAAFLGLMFEFKVQSDLLTQSLYGIVGGLQTTSVSYATTREEHTAQLNATAAALETPRF